MKAEILELKQAHKETKQWKSVLGFLEQENIFQKNKLAEILKRFGAKNGNLLEIAEQYQSQFLQQDEALRFIWNDLAELERSIEEESLNNDNEAMKINNRKEKLRKEIDSLQMHFDQLKSHFLHFFEVFSET